MGESPERKEGSAAAAAADAVDAIEGGATFPASSTTTPSPNTLSSPIEQQAQQQQENNFESSLPHTNDGRATISPISSSPFLHDDNDDDIENEDIQRMAKAFAPQMSELDDILRDFNETAAEPSYDNNHGGDNDDPTNWKKREGNNNGENSTNDDVWTTPTPKGGKRMRRKQGGAGGHFDDDDDYDSDEYYYDDDDGFDDELNQLAMSEQALRDELQFAADMSLLGSPGQQMPFDFPFPLPTTQEESRKAEDAPEQIPSPSAAPLPSTANTTKLSPDPEAISTTKQDCLNRQQEDKQSADSESGVNTGEETSKKDLPQPVALEFEAPEEEEQKEEEEEQVHLQPQLQQQDDGKADGDDPQLKVGGDDDHQQQIEPQPEQQQPSLRTRKSRKAMKRKIALKAPFTYSLQEHADTLKLRTETRNGGWYYCDMTPFVLPHSKKGGTTVDTVKDYCLPVPFKKLKRLYSGLVYHNTAVPSTSTASKKKNSGVQYLQRTTSQQSSSTPSSYDATGNRTLAKTTPGQQMIPKTPATPSTKDLMATAVPPDSQPRTTGMTPARDGKGVATDRGGTLSIFSPIIRKTTAPEGRPVAPPASAFQSPPPTQGTPLSTAEPSSASTTSISSDKSTSQSASKPKSIKKHQHPEEPLPFRTISIRVRPDVLCGAVMDAVSRALDTLPSSFGGIHGSDEEVDATGPSTPDSSIPQVTSEIPAISPSRTVKRASRVMSSITTHVLKRQGGHLRGAVYYPPVSTGENERPARAYVVDIQLCTQRNDDEELQRRLIVRFYHIQDDPEALHELGHVIQMKRLEEQNREERQQEENKGSDPESTDSVREDDCVAHEDLAANKHMVQASSLIQRIMAMQQRDEIESNESIPREQRRRQEATWLGLQPDRIFESESALQRAVGTHLEDNFKPCPSVREENKRAGPIVRRLTLPALSTKDSPMMDISWTLTTYIVDELDTRDCSYNTLSTLRFGQFPCLPTLDVHYCSQIRRLSRESMITQLLKSAKELEDYASSAEYNCALFVKLLEPSFAVYGVRAPDLPKAKSLDQYPLVYTPPQLACPPWGNQVMEALNQVAAKTPTGDIGAADAVRLVYRAFMTQDDEEQGARLGRKNAQIMDRLANMQTLQRTMVETIRDSTAESEKAADTASDFLKRSQKAVNYQKRGFPSLVGPEVPLMDIKISLGASTSGRCYVTSNQIQFVTTSIPLLGSTTTHLFDLNAVKFYVEQNPVSTLLNPFPHTMSLVIPSTREVVYSFRSAMNPDRLLAGLTVIQNFATETTPSVFSPMVEHSQPVEEHIQKERTSNLTGEGFGDGEALTGSEDGLTV